MYTMVSALKLLWTVFVLTLGSFAFNYLKLHLVEPDMQKRVIFVTSLLAPNSWVRSLLGIFLPFCYFRSYSILNLYFSF